MIFRLKNEHAFRATSLILIAVFLGACAAVPVAQTETAESTVESAPPVVTSNTDTQAEDKLPQDPQVVVGRLENGLTYYIRANSDPENRAELRLVVNAGSILEEPDQLGLAHFVEHLAFNGTVNFEKTEIVDFLESIGMSFGPDLNAYTSYDETVYQLQIPTEGTANLQTAVWILYDWAQHILFEEEEIEKEMGVIVEEWRLRRGASARMRDEQLPILYNGSRYAERRPIGDMEVLRRLTRERFVDFYTDWYRPDLMAVIAVGDFDADWVKDQIEDLFSRIEMPESVRDRQVYPVPDHDETLFAIASDPEATRSSVRMMIKRDREPLETVEDYRQILVESLYSSMLNGRLSELTKSADPPFINGFAGKTDLVRSKDTYILGANVKDGFIDRGLEALLTEAKRVEIHGFRATELEREKQQFLTRIERAYKERDTTSSRDFAEEYVGAFLENDPIPGIEYEYELFRKLIPDISLQNVNQLAGRWTTEKNRVVMVGSPEKEGLKVPEERDLLAVFQRVIDTEVAVYDDRASNAPLMATAPTPGRITDIQNLPDIQAEEWILSNGIRVILKPTDYKNDQIIFASYSPGGHSLVPDEDYIPAITAADIVEEGGLGDFDSIDLEKKLSGNNVSVSPWIGELFEGIDGSGSVDDMQTMFQLIHLYFTDPRKDPDAFAAYRSRRQTSIANRGLSPEQRFWDSIRVAMTQNHLRGRPWTLEMLAELDLDESLRIYRNRFAEAGDFTFIFTGSFELESMKGLVKTYLASLPSSGRRESWRDVGIDPPAGVVEEILTIGKEPKSRVQYVFGGSWQWSRTESITMDALARVLDIQLRESLREEKGGTYSVSVSASPSRFPDEEYRLFVGFGSDPDQAESLSALTLEVIELLKKKGPGSDNLNKVKEGLKRERETNLRSNDFWARVMRSYAMNGQPLGLIHDYVRIVEGLSERDILEAAKRYLDTERYVRFILFPEDSQLP